jgi:hypothetical protein
MRSLLAFVFALVSVGCSAERVTEALTPSPSASPSATVSASPTTDPTDAEPAIVVRTPLPGDEVVAPVTISGTADVFEATVSIRILDATGGELAAAFATATCGSGCRGRFSADVFFFTEHPQNGTIEVFESSAQDGSPLHLVSIPVVLMPGS